MPQLKYRTAFAAADRGGRGRAARVGEAAAGRPLMNGPTDAAIFIIEYWILIRWKCPASLNAIVFDIFI
jgi:hypothetical protein